MSKDDNGLLGSFLIARALLQIMCKNIKKKQQFASMGYQLGNQNQQSGLNMPSESFITKIENSSKDEPTKLGDLQQINEVPNVTSESGTLGFLSDDGLDDDDDDYNDDDVEFSVKR